MKLRTEINVQPLEKQIDHLMKGVSIGSCFAENIALRLQRVKFPVISNPFGVMYNPASVADTIERMLCGKEFTQQDLVRQDDLWSSFWCHGSHASTSSSVVIDGLNSSVRVATKAIQNCDYVIITFGSAWIFELSQDYPQKGTKYEIGSGFRSGDVVANCHKFPAQAFVRRRMTVEEIVGRYQKLFSGVLKDKQIIMTVSPVRHVKDGLAENNVSKSTLRLAIEELVGRFENVCYFPAFEIMVDDLRDYRFYDADMVHPSKVAVDYIWSKFSESVISQDTLEMIPRIEGVVSASEHRPINPESETHLKFLETMYLRTQKLQKQFPHIDFSSELKYFSKQ